MEGNIVAEQRLPLFIKYWKTKKMRGVRIACLMFSFFFDQVLVLNTYMGIGMTAHPVSWTECIPPIYDANHQDHIGADLAAVVGLLESFYCIVEGGNKVVRLSGKSLKDCEKHMTKRSDSRVAVLEFVYTHGILQHHGYAAEGCQLNEAINDRPEFHFYSIRPDDMGEALSLAILAAKITKPTRKVDGVHRCENQHNGQPIFFDVLIVASNTVKKFWTIIHYYGNVLGGDNSGFMHIAMDMEMTETTTTTGIDCGIKHSVFSLHKQKQPSF